MANLRKLLLGTFGVAFITTLAFAITLLVPTPKSGDAQAGFSPLSDANMTITTLAGQESLGSMRINGTPTPFGIVSVPDLTNFQLEITPIDHWRVFSVNYMGGESNHLGYGVVTKPWFAVDGDELVITFRAIQYNVSVVSYVQGLGVQPVSGVITNNAPATIGVGSVFSGVQLHSTPNDVLVRPNTNNFRIRNHIENRWDYFSAIGGQIAFGPAQLNSAFFTNYANAGAIEIQALFVRHYQLDVFINNSDWGGINIVSIHGGAERTHDQVSMVARGANVTITVLPFRNVRIASVTGGTLDANTNTISFPMNAANTIQVNFELVQFAIAVGAVDMDGAIIDMPMTGNVSGISIGGTFSASFTANPANYQFVGWMARIGNTLIPIAELGTVPTITNHSFTQSFVNNYADGSTLRLVAQFARQFTLTINVAGEGTFAITGGATTITTGGTHTFAYGTTLTIGTTPSALYMLGGIDGITGNTITIDGPRTITINFVPRPITVVANTTTSNGTITLSATEVRAGDVLVITFEANSGFEFRSWTLGGVNPTTLGATVNGNTILLPITADMAGLTGLTLTLDITAYDGMNTAFLVGMISVAVIVPILVLVMGLILVSNARKKRQYAILVEKRKQAGIMMGQADVLKKIREQGGENA